MSGTCHASASCGYVYVLKTSSRDASGLRCTLRPPEESAHFVEVLKKRRVRRTIRAEGVLASASPFSVIFRGPCADPSGASWSETKASNELPVEFWSTHIVAKNAGQENIHVRLYEKSPWNDTWSRVDGDDISFRVSVT